MRRNKTMSQPINISLILHLYMCQREYNKRLF